MLMIKIMMISYISAQLIYSEMKILPTHTNTYNKVIRIVWKSWLNDFTFMCWTWKWVARRYVVWLLSTSHDSQVIISFKFLHLQVALMWEATRWRKCIRCFESGWTEYSRLFGRICMMPFLQSPTDSPIISAMTITAITMQTIIAIFFWKE